MKGLIAIALLAGSGLVYAGPTSLNAEQMDRVTAGTETPVAVVPFTAINTATVVQVNASPVTVAQINALTKGSTNYAAIYSGNWADLRLIIK